jgi:hypothetical protein
VVVLATLASIGGGGADLPVMSATCRAASGRATDTLARMSERMRVSLGQPVVVENVTGRATIGVGVPSRGPRRPHARPRQLMSHVGQRNLLLLHVLTDLRRSRWSRRRR